MLAKTLRLTGPVLSFAFLTPALALAQEEASVTVGGDAAAATDDEPSVIVGAGDSGAATSRLTTAGGMQLGDSDWSFDYHGYFRAPLRFGIGSTAYPKDAAGNDIDTGEGPTTFHTPQIPDDQYLSWQHTRHNQKEWVELFFSVGNPLARGVVALQAFNLTDAAWAAPEEQFGISQAYVEITPEMPWQNVAMGAKVGTSWNRYGMAGLYDAGNYDTYLFGRTKVMGGDYWASVGLGDVTLRFETGLGGKRPNPQIFNATEFTMVAHGHAFATWKGLTIGAHILHSWANEEDRRTTNRGGDQQPQLFAQDGSSVTLQHRTQTPAGHLGVTGIELEGNLGAFGHFFVGYSYLYAKDSINVAPAIEVIHSNGGGDFSLGATHNYFDDPRCDAWYGGNQTTGYNMACTSDGTGNVSTILLQYDFSLMSLLKGLRGEGGFWGEGPNFEASLYAMFNFASSDYSLAEVYGLADGTTPAVDFTAAEWQVLPAEDYYSSQTKIKFGTDLRGTFTPVLGAGLRLDHVRPNDKLPEQAFTIISPRIEIKSRWITREMITIQYSYYAYAERACTTEAFAYQDTSAGVGPLDPGAAAPSGVADPYRCVQPPAARVEPDGWDAVADGKVGGSAQASNGQGFTYDGVSSGQPRPLPDEHVVKIQASMWW